MGRREAGGASDGDPGKAGAGWKPEVGITFWDGCREAGWEL